MELKESLAKRLQEIGRYWGEHEHMRDFTKGAMRLASNLAITELGFCLCFDADSWAIERIEEGAGMRLDWLRESMLDNEITKATA